MTRPLVFVEHISGQVRESEEGRGAPADPYQHSQEAVAHAGKALHEIEVRDDIAGAADKWNGAVFNQRAGCFSGQSPGAIT